MIGALHGDQSKMSRLLPASEIPDTPTDSREVEFLVNFEVMGVLVSEVLET